MAWYSHLHIHLDLVLDVKGLLCTSMGIWTAPASYTQSVGGGTPATQY